MAIDNTSCILLYFNIALSPGFIASLPVTVTVIFTERETLLVFFSQQGIIWYET